MNIRTTLGIAALAVTLPFTASAAMIKGAQGQSVSVDTAPYNLSSAAGQEMLYSKLQRAAEQVCGETDLRKAGSLRRSKRIGAAASIEISTASRSPWANAKVPDSRHANAAAQRPAPVRPVLLVEETDVNA